MESKQTGRVILILAVLVAAIFCIVPNPAKLFSSAPWVEKLNLKPGIDMVGGASLLYEIKEPPGGYHSSSGHTLAEDVMESLKKRVDPNGVRNLIWRPQGNNRLEIQLPSSGRGEEAKKLRDEYASAQRALDDTNVRPGEVIATVETLKGDARRDTLHKLAAGSPAREKLFGALASTYDQLQDARAKKDAATEAAKTDEYETLKTGIDATNLSVPEVESALEPGGDQRAKNLANLKSKFADFPARVLALDHFVAEYDKFASVKNSIDDAAQLKRELQGSGVLEFHIVANDLSPQLQQSMYQRLQAKGPRVEAGDEVKWFQVDRPDKGARYAEWNGKSYQLCYITPGKSMVNGPGIKPWALESAGRGTDSYGTACVQFQFDPQGGVYFGDFTGNNKGQLLAAILDDKIISAANINDRIGRSGTITRGGGYDDAELSYLIGTLNAGSMPARLADEPISERIVGPQLGIDNLKAGLLACAFGLVIVAIFLVCYYYVAGIVAVFAVFMNVVLILGILAAFNATFTLPGIAGIVLTIGAAVDANVLIFERLREEQHRGLSIRMAMRYAYQHAKSAIWDSNATTIITSIILIWLGSEEVKGFGLTLLIGLVSSLFTSLFVTRTIFNILIDKFNVQNFGSLPLTFPKWDALLKPNIDWMKLVPVFLTISVIFIGTGLTAFVLKARSHELADIDFASGTQVQFDLKQATKIEDLRALFTKADNPQLPAISLVSISADEAGKDKTYEIVTPNVNVAEVRKAVLDVLGDRLKLELPSTFDGVGKPLEAVLGNVVQPIDKIGFMAKGMVIPKADNFLGGVAIVLDNVSPALTPSEVRERINHISSKFVDFTVVSPHGGNEASSTLVVLAADTNLPFDKDQAKWQEDLVRPLWKLVNDSVNQAAQLQKVNNFDAQVAGDTRWTAAMSLILSSIVIMIYIWFRFGNLKYGTATVLAMVHDTLLVVGAIGLSHWAVEYTPGLAKILLIEPFRVNLTLVASVLTVMSYSMIDTIVVFDRVRENRGKFGHMSRRIMNDSINQTLSRTLLTAGTTIVTVAGMYVVGGPGIHGFTFVLLIGILVGTYSSIAIAAPIMLMGAENEKESGRKEPVGQLKSAGAIGS